MSLTAPAESSSFQLTVFPLIYIEPVVFGMDIHIFPFQIPFTVLFSFSCLSGFAFPLWMSMF